MICSVNERWQILVINTIVSRLNSAKLFFFFFFFFTRNVGKNHSVGLNKYNSTFKL